MGRIGVLPAPGGHRRLPRDRADVSRHRLGRDRGPLRSAPRDRAITGRGPQPGAGSRELEGPAAALGEIEPLAERLDSYHLFHATRAELLRRLGQAAEARDADRRALQLTENPAERELLERRLASENDS